MSDIGSSPFSLKVVAMWLALGAVVVGLALLVWSADKFIDGAAAVAQHYALPPLFIGAVIIGFGTSAPELAVSVFSALDGSPGLALGNAYGSNIANIALILGLTALISPVVVQSSILRKELPVLAGVTLLTVALLWDLSISRLDAILLLVAFVALLLWSVRETTRKNGADPLGTDTTESLDPELTPPKAWVWLLVGLLLLIVSSRMVVWGAVSIAQAFGVSELVIGLTIVAVGTSLPELASCIAAARKNEHDLIMGNIIGSNLFNTLAVVGLAGVIHPLSLGREILDRDMLVMGGLTLALFLLARKKQSGPGSVNRVEGALLLAVFASYTAWVFLSSAP
jgi:cation:H+ antiporter